MFTPFSNGGLFDSAFDQNESQNQEIEQEIIKCINRLYVISGMALWFQQYNMVHLTENWHTLFGIPQDGMFLLEDYLILIENPEERSRVSTARESLIFRPSGFEWCDTFTLRGQKIQSFAVVANGCIGLHKSFATFHLT